MLIYLKKSTFKKVKVRGNKFRNKIKNQNMIKINEINWIKKSIITAAVMFVSISIILPYFFLGEEITLKLLLIGSVIWLFYGFGIEYFLKGIYEKNDKISN